jgi:hypothetical protein
MADRRPTQREVAAAKKAERQQEMDRAIAEGRLTVRTMTPEERAQSDARQRPARKPRAQRPDAPRQG